MKAVLTAALLVAIAGSAGADTFSRRARVTRIDQTLAALRAMSGPTLAALETELHAAARTRCKSTASTPPSRCLLKIAREVCATRGATAKKPCQLVADLIIANLLAEKEFVPSKRRFELMNDASGYRAAMRRELLTRYAILVARMSLGRGFDPGTGLAASVDRFCIAHVRARPLTWARCVAAVVWYIGAAHKPIPNSKTPEGKP